MKWLVVGSENAGIKMNPLGNFSTALPANLDIPAKDLGFAIDKTELIPAVQKAIGTKTKRTPVDSKRTPNHHKKAMEKIKFMASLTPKGPEGNLTNKRGNTKRPTANRPLFLAFSLLIVLLTSSCVKHPQLLYFRNQSEFVPLQGHEIANQLRIKIQTDDVLFIMVRAFEQETADPFNLFVGAGMQNMNQLANNNPSLAGYLVDSEGNIDLPMLGRVNVAGKTVEEAKTMLLASLKPYLNDPVIIMRFLNFRFTVLGEVKAPRTITVPGERITLLEALGQAGDLTPYSNREKIMVIRENNGKREFGYVNIHAPDIFQSPYFYLQQNDIVYIEPIKEATAVVRDPISEVLPIISGLLSIAAILIAFAR